MSNCCIWVSSPPSSLYPTLKSASQRISKDCKDNLNLSIKLQSKSYSSTSKYYRFYTTTGVTSCYDVNTIPRILRDGAGAGGIRDSRSQDCSFQHQKLGLESGVGVSAGSFRIFICALFCILSFLYILVYAGCRLAHWLSTEGKKPKVNIENGTWRTWPKYFLKVENITNHGIFCNYLFCQIYCGNLLR